MSTGSEIDIAAEEAKAAEVERVRALWQQYKSDGNEDAREQLILKYSQLVRYVAGRVGVGVAA